MGSDGGMVHRRHGSIGKSKREVTTWEPARREERWYQRRKADAERNGSRKGGEEVVSGREIGDGTEQRGIPSGDGGRA